jgi:hypothetical protein
LYQIWKQEPAVSAVHPASPELNDLPPFPQLFDEPLDAWQWPSPPFDWHHAAPAGIDMAQPCTIETPSGAVVEGTLVGFEPALRQLSFRSSAEGAPVVLPFSRIRRLTLALPLTSIAPALGRPAERAPCAAQERDYRLTAADGGIAVSGRTLGHVETPHGLYLFTPRDGGTTLQRVFVPRAAYADAQFGMSAQDAAAEKWIATPRALLAALEHQDRMPILPLGRSLLALGLVTPAQLDEALAGKPAEAPLGEALVARGLISPGDLHTAIAHKMGYPFVDLTRFPIDPLAAKKLPLRHAVTCRALPILLDGDRLIVAMDRPSRASQVQSLYAIAPLRVVPVLASRGQLLLALSGLSQNDLWHESVSIRAGFFADTTH